MEELNQKAYKEREKRLTDAIALKKPDRVPVAPLIAHYFPTRTAGVSDKDAMQLYEKRNKLAKELTVSHDLDTALSCSALFPSKFFEILGLTQFKWPGGELREDQPFQFVDQETLKEDEYNEFLADPNGVTLKKIWPRISKTLQPLGQTPFPPLFWLSGAFDLAAVLPVLCGAPPILNLLKKLVALGEESERYTTSTVDYIKEMKKLGYPMAIGGVTVSAFDVVGDFLRGMKGVLLDMIRAPERLLETIEMILPSTIQKGIITAQQSGSTRVFIPLHWGGAGFMSNDQYARFYWPSFRALILGLLDAGLTPVPLFEGNYTPRLEFLKELPRGKVAGHFDAVDRRKAKDILGDTMCFWGNIQASLMTTGTPQQVKDDVKELIEIFGDTGGLIVDASLGIPDETRPENLSAMVEAVMEYGGY